MKQAKFSSMTITILIVVLMAAACNFSDLRSLPDRMQTQISLTLTTNAALEVSPALTATPTLLGGILGEHTVRSGEGVLCIARAYRVLPSAITDTNNLTGTILRVGQVLKIPPVEWGNMATGPVCVAQFESPFRAGANVVASPQPRAQTTPRPVGSPGVTPLRNPVGVQPVMTTPQNNSSAVNQPASRGQATSTNTAKPNPGATFEGFVTSLGSAPRTKTPTPRPPNTATNTSVPSPIAPSPQPTSAPLSPIIRVTKLIPVTTLPQIVGTIKP